jgi:hypothetical protein
MRHSTTTTTTTALSLLSLFASLTTASGDFSLTCPGNELYYYTLITHCGGPNADPRGLFNLENVLGNVDGNLVFKYVFTPPPTILQWNSVFKHDSLKLGMIWHNLTIMQFGGFLRHLRGLRRRALRHHQQ